MDPSSSAVAVGPLELLAALKQLTTEHSSSSATRPRKAKPEASAAQSKQQINRQRQVFHTLQALHQAFVAACCHEEGRELVQRCEKGTVDTFKRLVADADLHYLLTAATSTAVANVLTVLCKRLYSKAVVTAIAEAVKLAQARAAPRNVRLCTASCLGQLMLVCGGQQMRAVHDAGVQFLLKGLRASEACIREASLVALERAVGGCGRFLASHHRSIFQAIRGLLSDKNSDVRFAVSGTLAALATSQASAGGDKAFNTIRVHDFIEAVKKGLVDKLPEVSEGFARAMAGILALTCPDEVVLPTTRHLAGNSAFANSNANVRFHLTAKNSTRGTVTPLENAIDFAATAVCKPNFLASGVSQLRTQGGATAALTHLLRLVCPRLTATGPSGDGTGNPYFVQIVDRLLACLGNAALAPGNSSPADAAHAAALCARAFRRAFTAHADETRQLEFLQLALQRLKGSASNVTSPSKRGGQSAEPMLQGAQRLFLLREINCVIGCLAVGITTLKGNITKACLGAMVDPEPLVRHSAAEAYGTLVQYMSQDELTTAATVLVQDIVMAQAQVSAISATQGRAKIDRSAIWKLTGQALMLHCILLRLAAHSAPSENTKLLVTDVGSLAQSLVNQSQRSVRGGAAHSAAHGPPNSASAFSWGGWILVAGLAAFARQFTKQLIPLWVKAWGKRVQQQTTDSNAGSNGSHGGSDSSPASVLKLTPAQAEAAAKDLVPAATAILCFCRRHRDYLASRSTSAQSLCNTLLKLLLTLRARICSVAVNQGGSGSGGGLLGGSAPNVGGAQSDSTLLYALVLGSLQLLPAKRYVPAHKQVLVDAVQLFADKALATTSLATTLVRSRDAAACPLEMVQPGSMPWFAHTSPELEVVGSPLDALRNISDAQDAVSMHMPAATDLFVAAVLDSNESFAHGANDDSENNASPSSKQEVQPAPAHVFRAVRLINAAVGLFGDLFHLQEADDQERFMAHFGTLARQTKGVQLLRSPQMALIFAQHNCAVVCLRVVMDIRRNILRQHRQDPVNSSKSKKTQPAPKWFVACRAFLLDQLGNTEPTARHVGAKALSILVCTSIMMAKSSWAKSTIQALESTLIKAGHNDGTEGQGASLAIGGGSNSASLAALASRAGGLLALTYIFEALPPKKKALIHHSIIYDAARETRQPVRTWVLHAWGTLLRQLRHSRDFGKFVEPTLALIDAHLLCDVASICTGAVRTGVVLVLLGLVLALIDGMGPSLARGGGPVFDAALDACRDAWLSLSAHAFGGAHGGGIGIDTGDKYRRLISQTCLKVADRIATHHPGYFFTSSSPRDDLQLDEPVHPMLQYALAAVQAKYRENVDTIYSGHATTAAKRVILTSPTGVRYAVQCLYRVSGLAGDSVVQRHRIGHLLMHVLDTPAALKSPSLRKAVDSALRLVASQEARLPRRSVRWLEACVGVVKAQGDDGDGPRGSDSYSGKDSRLGSDSEDASSDSDDDGDAESGAKSAIPKKALKWHVAQVPIFRSAKPRWQTKCHAFRIVNHLISLEAAQGGDRVDLGALRDRLSTDGNNHVGIDAPLVPTDFLVGRIGTMVRLCCNFSAVQVTGAEEEALLPVQIAAVKVLYTLLRAFSSCADPDVKENVSILAQYETQLVVALRESFSRENAPAALVTVACQCVGHAFARGIVPTSHRRLIDVLVRALQLETGGSTSDGPNNDVENLNANSDADSKDPSSECSHVGREGLAALPVRSHAILSLLAKLWVGAEDDRLSSILEEHTTGADGESSDVLQALAHHAPLLQSLWTRVALDRAIASGQALPVDQRQRMLPQLRTWPDPSADGVSKFCEMYNDLVAWPRLAVALAACCAKTDPSSQKPSVERLLLSSFCGTLLDNLALLAPATAPTVPEGQTDDEQSFDAPIDSAARTSKRALLGIAYMIKCNHHRAVCDKSEAALSSDASETSAAGMQPRVPDAIICDVLSLARSAVLAVAGNSTASIVVLQDVLLGVVAVLLQFSSIKPSMSTDTIAAACSLAQHAITLASGRGTDQSLLLSKAAALVVRSYCAVLAAMLESESSASGHQSVLQKLFRLLDDSRLYADPLLANALSGGVSRCVTTLVTHHNEGVSATAAGVAEALLSRVEGFGPDPSNSAFARAASILWSAALSVIVSCFRQKVEGFRLGPKALRSLGQAYAVMASRFSTVESKASSTLRQVLQFLLQTSSSAGDCSGTASLAAATLRGACAVVGPTAAAVVASPEAPISERLACIQLLLLAYRVAGGVGGGNTADAQLQGMMDLLLSVFVRAVIAGPSQENTPQARASFKQLESTIHTAVLGLLQIARDVFKAQVAALDPDSRAALQSIMQKAMQAQQQKQAHTRAAAPARLSLASGF